MFTSLASTLQELELDPSHQGCSLTAPCKDKTIACYVLQATTKLLLLVRGRCVLRRATVLLGPLVR